MTGMKGRTRTILTPSTAPSKIANPPLTTNSNKQRNVARYMSITKLRTLSRIVIDRTRVIRAASKDPLTASANCLLVDNARYLGMLTVEVAACSAAKQLANKFTFALLSAFWATVRESWRLKMTKIKESIGVVNQVSESRWESVK